MKDDIKNAIMFSIINKVRNNIDALYDFSLDDIEFKENYKYTKKQIKQVVKDRF